MNSSAREWDAETYDRVSDPQFSWGDGGARAARAAGRRGGRSTPAAARGRVTAELLERLPGAACSPSTAPRRWSPRRASGSATGADYLVADLAELELDEPVDLDLLDRDLPLDPRPRPALRAPARGAAARRPPGRPVRRRGQRGRARGGDRDASPPAPSSRRHFAAATGIWNFAGAEETESRLRAAGFTDVRCWLEPKPVQPPDPLAFTSTVTLGPLLAQLPEELRRPFAEAVLERVRAAAASSTTCASTSRPSPPSAARAQPLESRRVSDAPRIVVLPGDGIGPEIVAAARQLLESLGEFEFDERLLGGCSIDAHGTALTDEVLEACRAADAVLLGAVGGPKWDTTDPDAPRPEQGLLGLRKGMGLYANLRPVRPSPALVGASPLREERIAGTDLLVVRELTGGIYFGDSGRDGDVAHDTCEYTAGGNRADRPHRLRGGAPPRRELRPQAARHLGRQGQRARDLAALARGGRPASPPTTPTSRSTTCWSTTRRCSWSRARPTST